MYETAIRGADIAHPSNARELSVPSEIGNLRHAADELEGTVKAMLDRLSRVMRSPDKPAAAQCDPPRNPAACSFQEDLRSIRDRINTSAGILQDIMQHLEI